ncbi:putative ATP/GTP binding protein [Actinacidiphila reveromycinica]|uniref:Putative ATP/GTP binding protein n=1 Tax=Actinacidiphila reveromycinica TaxID=659352 RepID=A0A7U3VPW6_9ACTN|nr:FxSxx-COOH system tetratricopeptide repeat protein [Streptomyces sp. SN-593]BBA99088.1 putative ATP/GTP binding protein [Streptomyces sp. SN-593]
MDDQSTALAAAAASAVVGALSDPDADGGRARAASREVAGLWDGGDGAPPGGALPPASALWGAARDGAPNPTEAAGPDAERLWTGIFQEFLRSRPDGAERLVALVAGLGAEPPAGAARDRPRPAVNVPIQLNVFAAAEAPEGTGAPAGLFRIPPRNRNFTGREDLLDRLDAHLRGGRRAVVQALRGWGGVGKTQIAVEFAHRHRAAYRLVWWLDAERVDLIGEQYAELAVNLDLVDRGGDTPAAVRAVQSHLQSTADWLIVVDNAESPHETAPWLPQGEGHVIITSRHQRWGELALPLDVDVLRRAESVALLRRCVPDLPDQDAHRLAEQLGDLPLALAQAGGFLTETGCSPAAYLESLRSRANEVLSATQPTSYPRSLAATVATTMERLADIDTTAQAVMWVCAFLAPEPVPVVLLAPSGPPGGEQRAPMAELTGEAGDLVALHRCVGRITNLGLGKPSADGIVVHRLTQAIVRDGLSDDEAARVRSVMEELLVAADPGDPAHPASWPAWARLMPHLLAANPADSPSPGLRALACNATWYLLTRAETEPGLALASKLHERWLREEGADAYFTMWAANSVARAWYDLGHVPKARELHEETYRRRRRHLGPDDEQTLITANNVARDLRAMGEPELARQWDEDTFRRRQRLLGGDHLHTLISGINLARDLRILGRMEEARALDEEVLELRRATLGEDHPHTLDSANSLARDLFALGQPAQARALDEDVLHRREAVLGRDHPHTLDSVHNLARDLLAVGETNAAYALDRRAHTGRRKVLGDAHRDTLISSEHLASYHVPPTGQEESE